MSKKGFLDDGTYYIHLHQKNIGSLLQSQGRAQINWEAQKQQVQLAVTSQYKQLLNTSLNGSSVEALSLALDLTETELINTINERLTQELQRSMDVDALRALHRAMNGQQAKSTIDISSKIKEAFKNGQNVKALSEVLTVIEYALSLLENDDGGLGAILSQVISEGYTSFTSIGIRLMSLLENYKTKNNYSAIKEQSLNKARSQLQNLAYALTTKQFKSTGSSLDAEGLSRLLINNLVGTAIAEGLGTASAGKALNILYKTITQAVGTQQVKVESKDKTPVSITGKTDFKTPKVAVSLGAIDGGNSGAAGVVIDIGVSSKFYTKQTFGNLSKGSVVVKSGSGGSLKDAINTIFGSSADRYLAYNYMAHNLYWEQLNDLILKRQIIRLFASAGTGDFAQFMLVNGKIVPIWDIIQYVLINNVGLSASKTGGSGGSTQGVALHINGRTNISASNKRLPPRKKDLIAGWERSKKVNEAISNATIEAEIHFANLTKSYHL